MQTNAVLAVLADCRFQKDTRGVLEEMGSCWLQGQQPAWAGSPRSRPKRGEFPFSAQHAADDEEGQSGKAREARRQVEQAEMLVQPLQQLEQVIVAAESLCRHVTYPQH